MRFERVDRVEQRREMLDAVAGGELTVTEACALWKVSRDTFYVWQRRRATEGDAGLENRSSRPRRSPARMDPVLEARIVDMRKAHPRWGARRIRSQLRRADGDAPVRSTVHQAMVRNGLVAAAPSRPPEATVRFERSNANELWQIDAKETELRDGAEVQILSVLDDHSRLCAAVEVVAALSCEAAMAAFDAAVTAVGLPRSVLSDNGSIFTARRTGAVNMFERHLWAQRVVTINGRPFHPQTQGKIERYHRTMNEWLEDNGPFDDLAALAASLTAFARDYNHERPNQALDDDRTPAEAFAAATKVAPEAAEADERCRRESIRRTTPTGNVGYGEWDIGLGRAWARTQVRVVDYGSVIEIRSADDELIRNVKPDHTLRYLGTGNPRGRPRRRENV